MYLFFLYFFFWSRLFFCLFFWNRFLRGFFFCLFCFLRSFSDFLCDCKFVCNLFDSDSAFFAFFSVHDKNYEVFNFCYAVAFCSDISYCNIVFFACRSDQPADSPRRNIS